MTANPNIGVHHRSPYHSSPPDFRLLADFDSRLLPFLLPGSRSSLNFKDANALVALTRALLLRDFGIPDWRCPSDRLCPTITSRLNYILHVQDLLASLSTSFFSRRPMEIESPIGVDIGTGASCILAILGSRVCGFRSVATEIDSDSLIAAIGNIDRNRFGDNILVVKGSTEKVIKPYLSVLGQFPSSSLSSSSTTTTTTNSSFMDTIDPLRVDMISSSDPFVLRRAIKCLKMADKKLQDIHASCIADFVVCNPPFFSSWEEAQRSIEMQEATDCTGAPTEMACPGGEVEFVSKMIRETIFFSNDNNISSIKGSHTRIDDYSTNSSSALSTFESNTSSLPHSSDNVRWCTSLLGKKSSISPLVTLLRSLSSSTTSKRSKNITIRVIELLQGRTTRWCLAWSLVDPTSVLSAGWRFKDANTTLVEKSEDHNSCNLFRNGTDTRNVSQSLEQSSSTSSSSSFSLLPSDLQVSSLSSSSTTTTTTKYKQSESKKNMKRVRNENEVTKTSDVAIRSSDDKRRNVRCFTVYISQCEKEVKVDENSNDDRIKLPSSQSDKKQEKLATPLTPQCRQIGKSRLIAFPSIADTLSIDQVIQEITPPSPPPPPFPSQSQNGTSFHPICSMEDIQKRIEEVFFLPIDDAHPDGSRLVILTKRLSTNNVNIQLNLPPVSAWYCCAILLQNNGINNITSIDTANSTDDSTIVDNDDTIAFTFEVQLAPIVDAPVQGFALISCSLLTSDESLESRASFERFSDRLRRDVVRDGRRWRRKGRI
jgi:23S rRNA A1618 N6-methylase RlmF